MKSYDSYKDSGIQWLPKIPSHWGCSKIKSHFRLRSTKVSDQDYPALSVSKNGITTQLETAVKTDNGDNRKLVKAGDFVVNSRSDRKGSCGVSPLDGSVSLINIVLEPIDGCAQYYHHLFRSNDYIEEFYRNGRGIVSDLWTTRWNEMSSIMIPFPPIEEQNKIVAYLDKRITLIENCKCQRERELQTLNELKQAEIASVVTRGLNPNVPMKDSGIPWIGQIPVHWDMKYLFQVAHEHYISNKDIHHQNLLSLSYGKIVHKDINTTEGLLPASFDTYQIIEPGNIVFRFTDLQNDHKSLRVGLSKETGIITSAYIAVEVDTIYILPEYFYYTLHSFDIKKLFYSMGGGLRQSLNYNGIRKLYLPIPPLEEQKAIVSFVDNKIKKIEVMIKSLESEIDRLTEYKQRLISDVVTGQIDVRGEQI